MCLSTFVGTQPNELLPQPIALLELYRMSCKLGRPDPCLVLPWRAQPCGLRPASSWSAGEPHAPRAAQQIRDGAVLNRAHYLCGMDGATMNPDAQVRRRGASAPPVMVSHRDAGGAVGRVARRRCAVAVQAEP